MIIGISGKLGSGKDLVGKIIQALTNKPQCFDGMDVITEEQVNYKVWDQPKFSNKKFADTLKDFICMLLSCTRTQLEDRDFKEGVLPEVWWYYKLGDGTILPRGYYPNAVDNEMCEKRYLVKTTPRLLLQLMGTECGRDILHPNIWVNAVMSQYKTIPLEEYSPVKPNGVFPNWIITDMRFPNELAAVEARGFTVRINRYPKQLTQSRGPGNTRFIDFNSMNSMHMDLLKGEYLNQHPSENALDNAVFDYTVDNNGTIKDLVDKIREILIKEKQL